MGVHLRVLGVHYAPTYSHMRHTWAHSRTWHHAQGEASRAMLRACRTHLGARWATTHTPRAHGLAPALCERETVCAGSCVGADGSAYMRDKQPRKWVRERGTPLAQARIGSAYLMRMRMCVEAFT